MRWLWLALIGLVACDRCTEKDPAASPQEDVGFASRVEAPPEARIEALVDAAFGPRATLPSEPPASLAWSVPPCSLGYELKSAFLGEVAEGREPAGKESLATLVANPGRAGLTLQLAAVESAMLADGARAPRKHQAFDWAPTLVGTDGRRFREIDGPTTLWASPSVVPALVELFPPLPDPVAGVEVAWEVGLHSHGTVARIEERRARGEAVPTVEPTIRSRRVAFEGWIAVEGDAAAVLRSSWHVSADGDGPVVLRRGERWRGRWVVLASGRLLHAALVANTWNESEVAIGDPRDKHGTASVELRLVEACDGPTLPRFARPPE